MLRPFTTPVSHACSHPFLPPSLPFAFALGYYKLSELVILMEHAHMPYNQYLRTMGGVLKQQSFVSKLDFDDLLKYLRGETATAKQVGRGALKENSRQDNQRIHIHTCSPLPIARPDRLNKAGCSPGRRSSCPRREEHSRDPQVPTLLKAPRTASTSIWGKEAGRWLGVSRWW